MLHTLLVVALCWHRLELDYPRSKAEQLAEQSAEAVDPQEFSLAPHGGKSVREAFDRPVSTSGPASIPLDVKRRESADVSALRQPVVSSGGQRQPLPRPLPLRHPQQALAQLAQRAPVAAARSHRPRQDAPPAAAVADSRPVLPKMSLAVSRLRAEHDAAQPHPSREAPGRVTSVPAFRPLPSPLAPSSVVGPGETMAASRPSPAAPPRRQSSDAGLDATSGGLARPFRSRSVSIAGPVVTPMPQLVTTMPSAPDAAAHQTASAFAQRYARQQQPDGRDGQPLTKTEAAVELGLEFLARAQLDDGHWEFGGLGGVAEATDSAPIIRADAAATGLAILSFLGAGYDHIDGRYQRVVDRGLRYLTGSQSPSGEIFAEDGQAVGQVARFYSHGIASLALCEAYGMTGDQRLREPAQAALDYLAATQHAQRGGWRYDAGTSADLSVTGWQLLALRSGELAGLSVRPETYRGIRYLVERCREVGDQRALFRYHPWASAADPRTRHGLQPSTVMTSVGLLADLYLGGPRNGQRIRLGADHLLANLPQVGGAVAPTGTLGNPLRDTYYWYYATQVMFHMGGQYWSDWQGALHPLLIESQIVDGPLAGSWDPNRPVPDKWAAYGGRIYVTALNLLSLEVSYRHLPLYDMVAPRVAERP
jgi:hypothetical protein